MVTTLRKICKKNYPLSNVLQFVTYQRKPALVEILLMFVDIIFQYCLETDKYPLDLNRISAILKNYV